MAYTEYNDIRQAIEKHFQDNWSATSVSFGNQTAAPTQGTAWIRATVLPGDAARSTLTGSPLTGHRHRGLVSVQIFVPKNKGTGEAMNLADDVRELLNEKTLTATSGLRIELGAAGHPVLAAPSEAWFQVNLNTPYESRV